MSRNIIHGHAACLTFLGLAAADVKTGQATRVPLTPHTPGHGEGAGDGEEEGSDNGLPVTTPAKAVLEFDAASDSTASELLSMQAASDSTASELLSMQAALMCQPWHCLQDPAHTPTALYDCGTTTCCKSLPWTAPLAVSGCE